MRFVPVKSTDQQDLQSLHRARDRLICQRTALINHTRGLLAEYGVVLPKGPGRFMAQAPTSIAGADLSHLARAIFGELMDQLDDLDRRIQKLDAMIVTLCRTNETCRRLAKLPGVGPIIATAIVGSVNDGRQFRGPRDGSLDRAGAQAVYNWRQATARRHRTTRQPLSQAPTDPWRTRHRQPVCQA
jgi:transposase